MNGHGGNVGLLRTLVIGLNEEGIEVATGTYFDLLSKDEVAALHVSDDRVTHAGEFETGTVLHLHPHLVDREAMAGWSARPWSRIYARRRFESVLIGRNFTGESVQGAIGNGSVASAERAAWGLQRSSEIVVEFLRHWVET